MIEDKGKLRVFICSSRNKDNEGIDDFKQRHIAFLAYDNSKRVEENWKDFVNKGKPGELCRLYKTVNARDEDKIKRKLISELALREDIQIHNIHTLTTSIAAKAGCAVTKKWLVDFDTKDTAKLTDFLDDLKNTVENTDFIESVTPTINGFAIILKHGFDNRELTKKYEDILEFKKDANLLVKWEVKGE